VIGRASLPLSALRGGAFNGALSLRNGAAAKAVGDLRIAVSVLRGAETAPLPPTAAVRDPARTSAQSVGPNRSDSRAKFLRENHTDAAAVWDDALARAEQIYAGLLARRAKQPGSSVGLAQNRDWVRRARETAGDKAGPARRLQTQIEALDGEIAGLETAIADVTRQIRQAESRQHRV
jgi:hypothetical protein